MSVGTQVTREAQRLDVPSAHLVLAVEHEPGRQRREHLRDADGGDLVAERLEHRRRAAP